MDEVVAQVMPDRPLPENGTLSVLIVTYHPDLPLLAQGLAALEAASDSPFGALHVRIWDNSCDAAASDAVQALCDRHAAGLASVSVVSGSENLGFGRANNRLLADVSTPYVLLLNQDAIIEPGALEELAAHVTAENMARIAAWEMRQIPLEHPKLYDPASLATPWVSGAATLFCTGALRDVEGFDEDMFMYAEDVDLSWRLRGYGYELRYVPRAAVFHDSYGEHPEREKPLQAVEGTLNNLRMRARFGSMRDIVIGLLGLGRQFVIKASFPGRRRKFVGVFFRFLASFARFRRSGRALRGRFVPEFRGWDFALRREGAFFRFRRRAEWEVLPQVSIIVRTHRRPDLLREALCSLRHQTWPNLQVVVVEDGEPESRAVVDEVFRGTSVDVVYEATHRKAGRSAAGNLGLSLATGEWLGFLDDDDQCFADHVEVLLQAALASGKRAAYGIAWEIITEFDPDNPSRYTERGHFVRFRQPFSRPLMWHCNYLPIQSVIFHRSLYEIWGGFAEDMDQLEDWNLWTRYSLHHDFEYVEKATSKYRVPASTSVSAERQRQLDLAYRDAVARQAALKIEISPNEFVAMAKAYTESRAYFAISEASIREALERFGAMGLARRLKRRLLAMRRSPAR